MVDGAPKIAKLAVDLHERLIQMPTPLRVAAYVRYPPLSDLGSKHRTKPVPPKPDRLMADVDAALGQEILDVAQRQRVLHVHHHDQTDHFWRAVEIPERVAHGLKLPQPNTARKIALTVPGDPVSIAFCETVHLDYVSCSPFRIPIARLAAAQAALGRKAASTT
jgi:hypothetical protein